MSNTLIVYYSLFQNTKNLALAPPVMSFLRQHDFAGKTVIPFCTHGGGGICQIENDIAKECSKSIILPGIAVNGAAASEEVADWLKTIGYEL